MTDPKRVRELFEELVGLPAGERAARLRDLDAGLRDEVASLLDELEGDPGFLDVPEPAPLGAEELPFEVLGRVRFVSEVGHGGMGTVYRGIDETTGDEVAIKVLFFGLDRNGSALERFEGESERSSRMDHPAIVRSIRSGSERGVHYIVMPFVEGSNLADEMAPERTRGLGPDVSDPKGVAGFVASIADGLAHAHASGVVHRDVKPANILIDRDGRPRLTDFGLARDVEVDGPTRSGDVTGTFAYMSPEQIRGQRHHIDGRSDVFSLGVVLYEMLVGCRPFTGDSAIDVAREIEAGEPVQPLRVRSDLPVSLQTICLKALESRREDRYPSMEAFRDDLLAYVDGRSIVARPPHAAKRIGRFVRRRRRALALVAVALAAATVGVIGGRDLGETTGVPVLLRSDPPGATVWVRRWDPVTGVYGDGTGLGRTPTAVDVQPGLARFVFRSGDASAELTRNVPTREALAGRGAFTIEATLVDATAVGGDMVRIPGGEFRTFTSEPGPWGGQIETWSIPAFEIDRTEVTVAEYRAFVEATGHPLRGVWREGLPDSIDAYPMTAISWDDARAYAEWVGKRLPGQLEFMRAVEGGVDAIVSAPRERFSSEMGDVACVGRLDGTGLSVSDLEGSNFARYACPIGSNPRDRSEFGVLDLTGSISEFVDRPWRSFDAVDSSVTFTPDRMSAVGASFVHPARYASAASGRPIQARGEALLHIGFRCARSVDPLDVPEMLGREPR